MHKRSRGNQKPQMSKVSAALTIWEWIQAHGRPPRASECRLENGLHHYATYYNVFQLSNFSASIIPMVSALCSSVKIRRCLGYTTGGADCPNTFPDQGPQFRLCETCKKKETTETVHHIPMYAQRFTAEDLGGGHANGYLNGWTSLEPWAQDIDWGT